MGDRDGGFEVDLAAVRDFGARLRRDVDDHLSPEAEHALAVLTGTPTFGATTASPDVQRAASVYREKLLHLLLLMDTFVHNGRVMAQAAADVVAAYEQADTMSGTAFDSLITHSAHKVRLAADATIDPTSGRQR